jgi:hypothetical protein
MTPAGQGTGQFCAPHNMSQLAQRPVNSSILLDFCPVSAEESLKKYVFRLPARYEFRILLQRGIVVPDHEAAALPGRFLPELGRSFGSGQFFC